MLYTFADCALDTHTYSLQRHGIPVRLRPKAFDVCLYLVTHRDRVVSKDELIEQLWAGQYLSDATLESTIHEVRRALGDSRHAQRYIQTVRGRGYRFVVTVQEYPDDTSVTVAHAAACRQDASARLAETGALPENPGVLAIAPLVGRAPELATLQALLEQAIAGQGQAVCLVGEPGIGTSRLLETMRQQARERSITCLEAQAHPWGALLPYLPLQELLRQQGQMTVTDSTDVIQAKVERCLQAAALSPDAYRVPLLALLGLDAGMERLAALRPRTRTVRISAALRQLFLASSRQRPLLLVLEDIHWLDATSQHWLAALVESLAEAPLFLLMTISRLDAFPSWVQGGHVTQIHLAPLSPQQSLELLSAILMQTPLPDTTRQHLVVQARGSPLFLEELARLVTTHETLGTADALPETLPEVIAARLAQLTEPARRLAQTAAIWGPYASWSVCQAMWGDQEAAGPLLAELERQAFYVPPTATAARSGGFTHPLRWEVVYGSLPPAARQALHGAAASVLATQAGAEATRHDDLLLYHQTQTAEGPLALHALHTMAMRAATYGASAEALSAIHQALTHVVSLPAAEQAPRRTALLLDQAQTLIALRRFQEAHDLLRPSPARAIPLQDVALHSRWALLLSQASAHLQAWDEAVQYAHDAVVAASHRQDNIMQGQAYALLAMACYQREDPVPGLEYSRQALDLLEHAQDQEALGLAFLMQGLNAFLAGEMPVALHAIAAAERLGAARGDPQIQTYAAWLTGWLHATCGAWEESIVACQRSRELAVEPLHTAFAQGWLGYAYLGQGNPMAAQPLLEHARQHMHAAGYQRGAGLYTTLLAACHQQQGRLDTAQALGQQGLTLSRTAAHRLGIGWAQRVLGLIAQATGSPTAAWSYGQDALATFASIPARCDMGQTHLLLAEIAQVQEQAEIARQHVLEAYRLFQTCHVRPSIVRAVQQAEALGLTLRMP